MRKIAYPGLRIIKTAVAIFLTLLFYGLIGRENVTMAVIAALMCMQDSVHKSIRDGGSRIFGTCVGGLFGILFMEIDFFHTNYAIWLISLTIGIIILMQFCNVIGRKESIIIGCVVYLVIAVDAVSGMLGYALNRILDTAIGIIMSVLVNTLLFRPRGDSKLACDCVVTKHSEHKIGKWSGGETTELYIAPESASYSSRDFDWRVSAAVVELEESEFTVLAGYKRYIMPLDGSIKLEYNGDKTEELEMYQYGFFDGSWTTKCYGKCRDFNLMLREGYSGRMKVVRNFRDISFKQSDNSIFTGYYVLDNLTFKIFEAEELLYSKDLEKGDFVRFENLQGTEHYRVEIVNYKKSPGIALAVVAEVELSC